MKWSKTYSPKEHEDKIYALWEKNNVFSSDSNSDKPPFSVVLPPPNANGDLHVGHSLMFAIQDAVIRFQRMQGREALWLPGADHAGFETQVVYEKKLAKTGKSRFDFSREELYQQIWDFVDTNKDNYLSQFRKLGASVDWDTFVFTLDAKIIEQAYRTFKKMWDDGLIYRGERLVNFCTFHGTAFADIEVEYKNVEGNLWYIDYPLSDGSGFINVATTRPETMLGDVAVAVHPTDKRYKNHIGKTLQLPLTKREIPVIADEMVDTTFGTGAVKITPAHDPNDYEVAERHDLPKITVIGHDGLMTAEAGKEYMQLEASKARTKVVNDLKNLGLLKKTVKHEHSVGHCYKCGTIIQPLLKEQWFVDMQPLARPAIQALENKEITFYPDSKRIQLVDYLKNLKDWNISRQIVWGIPIPAFQSIDNPDVWIFDTRTDQPEIVVDGKTYRRDPDVFDTWFSSSSWPYATLEKGSGNYKKFYPNSLMETGGEILYPWVSRMIMLGLYETGKVPFNDVYIHGYVLASDGTKMSKSVGNVVSPLAMIDKYGSDALRMGLITDRAPGINRPFDEIKLVGGRNFANKLWNIARYVDEKTNAEDLNKQITPRSAADHWILQKLHKASDSIANNLSLYRFSEALDDAHNLIWNEFADWYIEASKNNTNGPLLRYVLESALKVAHPFAPFVTETIWQQITDGQSILARQSWPTIIDSNKKQAQTFDLVKDVVTELRALTKTLNPAQKTLYTDNASLSENAATITQLSKYTVQLGEGKPQDIVALMSAKNTVMHIDKKNLAAYTASLKANIDEYEQLANTLRGRLSNKAYLKNAPKNIVEQSQNQLKEIEQKIAAAITEQQRFAA